MNHPVVRFVLWFWLVTMTPPALGAAALFLACVAGRCTDGLGGVAATGLVAVVVVGIWALCAWGLGLIPYRRRTV